MAISTRIFILQQTHKSTAQKPHLSSRFALRVSCKNRLTKPRVCGIILSASERVSPRSNQIFRGIAQLVEQRSPNVNAATIIRINTELSRLGTSVSSLFSCFQFWMMLKSFMQNRGHNLQKIPEHHQKTSTFPTAEKGWLILFWVMEIWCSCQF